MKQWVLIAGVILSSAFHTLSHAAENKDFKVTPYGKFFKSPDGDLTVEMAVREDKNEDHLQDVLLKITGEAAHNEGIDGKTLYYTAEPAGTGANFSYSMDGQTRVRMLTRDSWGSWKFFEVFVDGKTFKVYPDAKKNKEVRPLNLLSEYKKSP